MRHTLALGVAIAGLLHAAVAQDAPKSFNDTLYHNANLTSFAQMVSNYSDIAGALSWSNGFTLLAPSNDAIAKIPYTSLKNVFLNGDVNAIHAILQYHVLNGNHPTAQLNASFQFFGTWLQNQTYTNVTGGQRVGMVQQAGDTLIVTSGYGTRSTVTQRDIQTTNCLIQVIDNLLVPPDSFIQSAPQFNLTGAGGLFQESGANDYLARTSDVTLFVPKSEALARIGSGLSSMSSGDLAGLVNYHMVNGSVMYTPSLYNNTVLKTVQGGNLTVHVASNRLFINSAEIVQPDLLIADGVMHVIDNVLNPNATGVLPNAAVATQGPVIAGSSVASIPFTSYMPCTTCTTSTSSSSSGSASATGSGSTTTGRSSTTTSAGAASSTKKSDAGRAAVDRSVVGGAAAMALGIAVLAV